MSKLEWKEGDIRCMYAEHKDGERFIVAGTDSYQCGIVTRGNETKTIGFAKTLEAAKQLHEKDISKKLEKKGFGDGFGLE